MKIITHNAAIVYAVIQIMKHLGYDLERVTTPDDQDCLPPGSIDTHDTVVRVVRNVANYDCDTQLEFVRGRHCTANFEFDFLQDPNGYVCAVADDSGIKRMVDTFRVVMDMLDYGPTSRASSNNDTPLSDYRVFSRFADYVRGMILLGHMAMGPMKWQPGDVAYGLILQGVGAIADVPSWFESQGA